jgi:hypothetical protein
LLKAILPLTPNNLSKGGQRAESSYVAETWRKKMDPHKKQVYIRMWHSGSAQVPGLILSTTKNTKRQIQG